MPRRRKVVAKVDLAKVKNKIQSVVGSHLGADVGYHVDTGAPFWVEYGKIDNAIKVSLPTLKGLKGRIR